MKLKEVYIAEAEKPVDITIIDGKISKVEPSAKSKGEPFNRIIAFPGLINSHDHLDFNLFPQLGQFTYRNYTEWGHHLHSTYQPQIRKILRIPARLRAQWGVYKNLLCGITTVVHHGEIFKELPEDITIYHNTHNLHSVQFERHWKIKLNHPFKKRIPCVIHTGEGTDLASHKEIDQLLKWNLIQRKLIGIHGISMNTSQAKRFKALVWCPVSNFFMFQKTAAIRELKQHTKILFGTDSTLTAEWNIWNHIRKARETGNLTDRELYETLTINPADIWNLPGGRLSPGMNADLVIAQTTAGNSFYDSFLSCQPEHLQLVIKKGKIVLIDEDYISKTPSFRKENFAQFEMKDTCKYMPAGLAHVMNQILYYAPEIKFPLSVANRICH